MTTKLIILLLIILHIQLGVTLTLIPWVDFGLFGNWDNNHLLVMVVQKSGSTAIGAFIRSGWVKGAVSGFGLLNILFAFMEIARFGSSTSKIDADGDGK
ncbi:MAG: hypothetical protein ACKN97_03755 [Acidobacteriota bacterium]